MSTRWREAIAKETNLVAEVGDLFILVGDPGAKLGERVVSVDRVLLVAGVDQVSQVLYFLGEETLKVTGEVDPIDRHVGDQPFHERPLVFHGPILMVTRITLEDR